MTPHCLPVCVVTPQLVCDKGVPVYLFVLTCCEVCDGVTVYLFVLTCCEVCDGVPVYLFVL